MSAPAWIGVVTEDGTTVVLDDERGFHTYLKKFAADEIVLTVKRRPRPQGTQAMRYYRGIVVPDIARACGYADPDDWEAIHDALAWKFLRLPDHPQLGTPRRRSTAKADLTQEEMSQYLDQVMMYAETSIPGCHIRRPEDVELDDVIDVDWT